MPKIYGSVNSAANTITELYGSVGGVAERIQRVYGPGEVTTYPVASTNYCTVDEPTLQAKIAQTVGKSAQPVRIAVTSATTVGGVWYYNVALTYELPGSTSSMSYPIAVNVPWGTLRALLTQTPNGWGITLDSTEPESSVPTYRFVTFSEVATVQRVLIYDKGYVEPPTYGTVYYQPTSASPDILSVKIKSLAEFNSLVGTSPEYMPDVEIGGVTVRRSGTNRIVGIDITENVSAIPDYFLKGCLYLTQPLTIPSSVTSIGTGFLYGCIAFNQPLIIPNGVTTIGDYFLYYCTSFNQPLTLPSGITTIGNHFLQNCTSFNQSLTLPSSLETINESFLYGCTSFNQPLALPNNSNLRIYGFFLHNCDAMVSTLNVGSVYSKVIPSNYSLSTTNVNAPCYTTGITISGTVKSLWKSMFPDRDTSPYRKLL